MKWKASASSRRAFVIPKEPNWPPANAGSAAEIISPLLVIGAPPSTWATDITELTVAVEIRRSTRLPGPDGTRSGQIIYHIMPRRGRVSWLRL
ncbi:hypothetical protein PspLS_00014, partial [Pyricularia sp. CBS 133598]